MRGCGCIIVTLAVAASAVAEMNELTVHSTAREGAVEVLVGGELFTTYTTAVDQKYPYFYPVNGPLSGDSVTTESSEPYPHHHSLFFGCDHVNGGNYWQEGIERGQIVSQKTEVLKNGPDEVVLRDACVWQQPGEAAIIRDERTFTISAPSDAVRLIEAEFELTPLVDVTITKTNHSLFSARMAPELAVTSGGTLVNAVGGSGEKGTFEVASPWCDYFGTRDGVTEGLAIVQHPKNRWYPSQWFTRDYGFFSPTPLNWIDEVRLAKGEALRLRYRVVVHGGTTAEAKIGEIADSYGK